MIRSFLRKSKFLMLVFVTGCYEFPEKLLPNKVEILDADITRLVIVGDAMAAGLMDGALYTEGQGNSFPSILYRQIYGVEFPQAEIGSDNGVNQFIVDDISGKFYLTYNSPDTKKLTISTFSSEMPADFINGDRLSISDLAIPGLRMPDISSTQFGSENIYFNRIQSSSNSSIIDEISLRNPSFLVICLGVEDILGYTLGGATGSLNSDTPHNIDATDIAVFENRINEFVQFFFNGQRKGVISTIPDITATPLLNYISPILDERLSFAEAAQVNSYYSSFNADVAEWNFNTSGVTAEERRPFIEFAGDGPQRWGAVVIDPTLSDAVLPTGKVIPKWRQLGSDEHILLMYNELIGRDGIGTFVPLPDEWILTKNQAEKIRQRINEYNEIIRTAADTSPDLAIMELSDFYVPFFSFEGIRFNGVPALPDFYQNGIFSADGFYLNARGQAFLANEFINVINQNFNGNVPLANPNNFKGNNIDNNF